jgi:hypothetical protein
MFCPECGENISDEGGFCPNCGAKIRSVPKAIRETAGPAIKKPMFVTFIILWKAIPGAAMMLAGMAGFAAASATSTLGGTLPAGINLPVSPAVAGALWFTLAVLGILNLTAAYGLHCLFSWGRLLMIRLCILNIPLWVLNLLIPNLLGAEVRQDSVFLVLMSVAAEITFIAYLLEQNVKKVFQ